MKKICIACIAFAAVTASAHAAPPTVVPSPGYDARLQEQRAASSAATSEPVVKRVAPRHHKQRRIQR
ncbi:hypothetical protein JQ604_35085 [Bradyrhizobium jicamae]|uniref:hypothetical protein n=1 Tax=Bradyrhizobium jicamae TaxID=280332 RepID=UPI001BACA153|nr:hypothetical protein [Bradyrhizobium jicamae]MBR0757436.1 hypothetical protein [Bradyrhizobium jicamae]